MRPPRAPSLFCSLVVIVAVVIVVVAQTHFVVICTPSVILDSRTVPSPTRATDRIPKDLVTSGSTIYCTGFGTEAACARAVRAFFSAFTSFSFVPYFFSSSSTASWHHGISDVVWGKKAKRREKPQRTKRTKGPANAVPALFWYQVATRTFSTRGFYRDFYRDSRKSLEPSPKRLPPPCEPKNADYLM